ncbi:MAG: polysaccharide deacetylase family protein [Proteobacteria bacterium]|nr:polysaccharide deacetylase family protein [Pseudomonadota bacterium]
MLRDHGRYGYSAIVRRPDYHWPERRRLAFYVALNLEHFAFGEGLGAELAPGGPPPDVLNFSWRDYGNRVGVWRMAELFDELKLPCSVLVNSVMYDHAPEVIVAFRGRGDEIVGHGRTNAERQGTLDAAAEAALIREATEVIARHEGKRPAGWLGPWISESQITPDLLQEAGYTYLLDWCQDDQPIWFRTRHGRILGVPYPQEINDIPMIVARKLDADAFADMIVDNFDEMRVQCRGQPLVMGVALHAYLVGQPYRLRHLRRALRHVCHNAGDMVWTTTAGGIAAHVTTLPPGTIPGG